MDATVLQIADAVVATLNALPDLGLNAERKYVPVHEIKDLTAMRTTVVPRELSLVALSRHSDDFDYVIDVAVQKRVPGVEPGNLDPYMFLMEQILDAFRGRRLDQFDAALCVRATNLPIFEPTHLDEHRVFTSVVSLTFRVARNR